MVEMTETAAILHNATPRSLVLLDEIGRGTATFDGLSIAWAVAEHLHDSPEHAAKTLFATHYHELTALSETLPRLRNLHVEIAERGGELAFLYRVVPGVAEGSYGVYAAKLAGLPAPVVRRAEELLREYESGDIEDERVAGEALEHFDATAWGRGARIVEELLAADIDSLAPVEALMKLFELRRLAEGEKETGTVAKSA
jgi:DNA mismatch repair protein MutS